MKFVNPLFLYGLFLIIIPIVIHLFNLRKYKVVYFTNVKYLRELKEETQKQSILKHLLILLSRILAITFLVMAFARPYFPTEQNRFISAKDFISIYIDNSFSMQAASTKGNGLDMAKGLGLGIYKSHRNTDDFHVLSNDFKNVHNRILAHEEVPAHINDIDFSYYHRTLSDLIARQQNTALKFTGQNKKLYIVSDFQKSMFDLENLSLDSLTQVYLVPINTAKTNNLFIDTCWFDTPVKRLNDNVILHARIVNISDELYEKVPAKVVVNNEQRAISSFDCAPRSSVTIQLSFKINQTGIHHGFIEITDYPITYDDKLFFSFMVADQIKLLSINKQKENIFISNLFKNDSSIVFDQAHEMQTDYSTLNQYDLVILNGLNEVSSGMGNEIKKYIEEGGQVLMLPGTQINTLSYNTFLSTIGDVKYQEKDTQNLKINYINLSHSLYKNVFEKLPENINLPDVKQHYPFQLSTRVHGEDILKLQNNNSFLSLIRYGNGYLYVSAVPYDRTFSNFPLHALFVPTVYNIAINSYRQTPLYYILGAEKLIDVHYKTESKDDILKIRSASGDFEFIPQQQRFFSFLRLLISYQIEKAGSYLLTHEQKSVLGLAFNYNRKESLLDYYEAKTIEADISKSGLNNIFVINTQTNIFSSDTLNINNKGKQLHKLFVFLALIFLGIEVLLLRFMK